MRRSEFKPHTWYVITENVSYLSTFCTDTHSMRLSTYENGVLHFQDLKESRIQRMQSSITNMKEKRTKIF